MKYLKKFELTSEYEAQKSSLPDPWVALTEDDHKIHYKDTIIHKLLLDYTNTVPAYSTESVINCSGVTVTITSDGIVSSAVTTAYTETITYTENTSETETKVNSGTLTWNDAEAEYTITQDVAVYYTITFLNDDDTLIESGRYMETKSIVVPSDPSKEHYVFKGWTPEVVPTAVADATYTAVFESIYKAIDLGLPSGRKWANMNVGATTESGYGKYFQWGDTVGYTDASHSTWNTAPFNNGSSSYNASAFSSASGTACPGGTLALSNDAARANMSGDWRMPTTDECIELVQNTNNTWTTVNGVNGRRFTSKTNGNSIFIPAGGFADSGNINYSNSRSYVWTSSLRSSDPSYAYGVFLTQSSVYGQSYYARNYGCSIRGVC